MGGGLRRNPTRGGGSGGEQGEQGDGRGREEQCWPLVKCLVFHKQAASSYTLPETPSLRRGFKEKHVDLPHFGAPSWANFSLKNGRHTSPFFWLSL